MVAWSVGRGGGGADEEDRKEGHMRGIVQEEGEVYCVWVNGLD